MAQQPTRRRRRWLFAAVALLLFAGGVEALSFVAWWIRTGEPFTWGAVEARATEVAGSLAPLGRFARKQDARTPDRPVIALHPYLGFTMDPGRNDPGLLQSLETPVDDLGFLGAAEFLGPRQPGELRVAIVGGSVASMLALFGGDALADAMEEIPALAQTRVRIVNLAVGAYKQPQQLLALAWFLSLGGQLDVVVNLDGLNEVMLPTGELQKQGISPFYPWSWSVLAGERPTTELLAAAGRVVFLRRARAEAAAALLRSPLRRSPTAALIWSVLDARREAELSAADAALAALPTGVPAELRGPRIAPGQTTTECVRLWARTSRLLDDLCRTNGIRYFHFLQPNQYVAGSKPIGDDERQVAIDPESRLPALLADAYPRMRTAGAALAADGIRFDDLTMVFADVAEPLYQDDCCHLNRHGNELLARAIAGRMAAGGDWGPAPEPIAVTALAVEPASVRFDTPLDQRTLRVLGRTEDGRRVDVTHAATSFASSAPDGVAVDRFGTVTALAPGTARITVAHGGATTTVTVEVAFPPIVDLGGGARSGRPGGPKLEAERTDAGQITVRSTGVDGLDTPVLCVATHASRRPTCGGTGWVDPLDATSMPLSVHDDGAEVTLPAPPAGSPPVYVQLYAIDRSHRCGWALSNALAITPR